MSALLSHPDRKNGIGLGLVAALALAASLPASGNGPEFVVNASSTTGAQPDIGSSQDGAFVVAWTSTPEAPASFSQTAARRYAASGEPLGGEFRIDSSATAASMPTIAINAAGQFVVAWWHFDGFEIRGRRHTGSGAAVGTEFIASNPPFASLTQIGNPAVAGIFLDQFVVLWEGTGDFLRYDIVGRRIDSNGVPIGNGFVVNTNFASDHQAAAVASDPLGNYVVAWQVGGDILARKFTSGGVFGPPFAIASGASSGVALGVDAIGNVVAVWNQDGTVQARRFGADTLAQGPAFRVDTSGLASFPDVATYADGRFVVVWQLAVDDIEDFDVLARPFDATGKPESGELLVNVSTEGVQSLPAVAAGSGSEFIVVWTSQALLTSVTDVVGRRMGANDLLFANGFE